MEDEIKSNEIRRRRQQFATPSTEHPDCCVRCTRTLVYFFVLIFGILGCIFGLLYVYLFVSLLTIINELSDIINSCGGDSDIGSEAEEYQLHCSVILGSTAVVAVVFGIAGVYYYKKNKE